MKAQRFLSQPSVLFPSAVTIKHSLQNIYKPLAFPVKKLWLTQDHDYIPALFSAPTLPLSSANLSLSLHFVFGAADKIQNSFQMSGPQNIHTDGRGPLITQLKLQWLIMLTILKLLHLEKGFIAMIEGRGISFMISANDSHNLITSVCEAAWTGDTISNSTCIQIQFRACDRFEELLNESSGSGNRICAL